MAYAAGLKPVAFTGLRVRIPPSVPLTKEGNASNE